MLRSVLSEDYQDDRDLEPALSEPMSHDRDKHVSKEQQGGVTDDVSGTDRQIGRSKDFYLTEASKH